MSEQFYMVGTLALWAGDYKRAEELFNQDARLSRFHFDLEPPRSAMEYIALAREERQSQLIKQREEFHKNLHAFAKEERDISAGGYPLRSTQHLAGVLFQKGARSFEMRGFLKDMNWSKQLLKNAEQLWDQAWQHRPVSQAQQGYGETRTTGKEMELGVNQPTSFNWEYPGELFLQVHVNCLGMILTRGFWSSAQLPEFDIIEGRFRAVLRILDPEDDRKPIEQVRQLLR